MISDWRKAIDLGVLTIPSLLTQLAPFLGPDENLTVVARGTIYSITRYK